MVHQRFQVVFNSYAIFFLTKQNITEQRDILSPIRVLLQETDRFRETLQIINHTLGKVVFILFGVKFTTISRYAFLYGVKLSINLN